MIKNLLREVLLRMPFKITQNLHYDRLTRKIIRSHLSSGANAIDVGCHKGEVMDIFLKAAPLGNHIGIEPIPDLADYLQEKYENFSVQIHPIALSDFTGYSDFNLVTSNPAYSGLKRRTYDRQELDRSIRIEVRKLDELLPKDFKVDMIKIDVEGGELGVLKGGEDILNKWHPILIFEHGKGAAEHYGYGPKEIYKFLSNLNYQIYTLDAFMKEKAPLRLNAFNELYEKRQEYYFLAAQKGAT